MDGVEITHSIEETIVTLSAFPASGKAFSWAVLSGGVSISGEGPFYFYMPAADVSLHVEFFDLPDASEVEINGVTWATRNVAEPGVFAGQLWDYGNYYTYDEAQKACPAGWRTPTIAEGESLYATAYKQMITINEINGLQFHSGSNSIFFPMGGLISSKYDGKLLGKNSRVEYWSAIPIGTLYGRVILREYTDDASPDAYPVENSLSVRCVKGEPPVEPEPEPDPEGDGVEINGVTWAIRSVGMPGTFVAHSWNIGDYYSFAAAQEACPAGWRTPTWDEIQSLMDSRYEWTTLNGVNGYRFGSGDRTLFFPASGVRLSLGVSYMDWTGFYWSDSDERRLVGSGWYALNFFYLNSDSNGLYYCIPHNISLSHGYNVRCVKE